MPSGKGYRLDWKGNEVKRRILQAARRGIDETMGACVEDAQPNTPVVTGNLRRSIKIQELAQQRGDTVSGLWGSADVNYALWVETGARGRPGVNMLRGAASKEYPKLSGRIRDNLK